MSSIFTAAEDRALPLRRRPDIRAVVQQLRGKRVWALKDPAALRYFHLSDEERFLYEQLDGHASLGEIQSRFESRYAPQRISLPQLQTFLGTLHREGLLLGNAPRQGDVLHQRRNEARKREFWSRLAGVLAIRFRGVDPQKLLDRVYPQVAWMFSRWALGLALMLVLAAGLLIAVEWRAVSARLPELTLFFGGQNLLWLAATLAGVKVLHELGHALTLRHFGGSCHEIGPMLLLLTPCLYCNTTDAWMLSSKWRRAAVAAAGIGVELVLAAAATFLWWWSEPGWFHSLCLNVMVVCSVSTVLFNGNPLLRYDGYYVLADLLETPNLAQQASALIRAALAKWFLGLRLPVDQLYGAIAHRGFLAAFWLASLAYRIMVIALILWGLHHLLGPLGLDLITGALAAIVVAGMLAMPVMSAAQFVRDPQWRGRVNLRQLGTRAIWTLGGVLLLLIVPLPARISAPAVLRHAGAERIYVTVPGTILWTMQPGERVHRGQVIAKLEDSELSQTVRRTRDERDRQRLHLRNLRRQSVRSNTAAEAIPAAESALADLERRLAEQTVNLSRLEITAPRDGVLIAPPSQHVAAHPRELSQWSGSPLEPRNRGTSLPTGTLLGLIGNPTDLEATLLVDQQDVALVRAGQTASLNLGLYPGQSIRGTIQELSPSRVDELPRELVALADVPQQPDSHGKPMPLGKIYQARVRLDEHSAPLIAGATGRARIHIAPQSVFARLSRFFSSTFRIKW